MLLKIFSLSVLVLIILISTYLVKAQEMVWEKKYSIDSTNTTLVMSVNYINKYIYETPNNEFILISETILKKDSLYSLNLTKIDSNGNIIWNKSFIDKFPNKYPAFFNINSNNEYNFIYKYYNYDKQKYYLQINKLDEYGNFLYKSPKDSLNIDSLYYYSLQFIENDDSTFILIGNTNNRKKMLFRKYNYDWMQLYQTTIDSIGEQDSIYFGGVGSVTKTYDGNLLIFTAKIKGPLPPVKFDSNQVFYKLDKTGIVLFKFKTELSSDTKEGLNSGNAIQMKNRNIAILGKVSFKIEPPADSIFSTLLIQFIDTTGKILWRKYYGNSRYDIAYSYIPERDGGFVIAGKNSKYVKYDLTVSNLYLIKTDSAGNMEWEWTSGRDSIREEIVDVIQTNEGDFLIIGNVQSPYDDDIRYWRKLYFAKLRNKPTGIIENSQKNNLIPYFYPNPFHSSINIDFNLTFNSMIKLEIYNLLGERLYSKDYGYLESGTHKIQLNPDMELNPGYYLISLKYQDKFFNYGLIKEY